MEVLLTTWSSPSADGSSKMNKLPLFTNFHSYAAKDALIARNPSIISVVEGSPCPGYTTPMTLESRACSSRACSERGMNTVSVERIEECSGSCPVNVVSPERESTDVQRMSTPLQDNCAARIWRVDSPLGSDSGFLVGWRVSGTRGYKEIQCQVSCSSGNIRTGTHP